jgi:hypothetical protein
VNEAASTLLDWCHSESRVRWKNYKWNTIHLNNWKAAPTFWNSFHTSVDLLTYSE